MRSGARDFIVKSRLHRLAPVVERELTASALRAEHGRSRGASKNRSGSFRNLSSSKRSDDGRRRGARLQQSGGRDLSYADLILHSLPPAICIAKTLRNQTRGPARGRAHAAAGRVQRQQVLHKSVLNLNDVVQDVRDCSRSLSGRPWRSISVFIRGRG
jgi:hypothetical protein